jgi:hypothetical protein
MKLFITIAALFSLPIFAKAGGLSVLGYACDPSSLQFSTRMFLPFVSFVLGYAIFLLEGTQSSVILSNKQSAETLSRTLESVDITKQERLRAERYLKDSVDHAPIDNFVVGRQLLIITIAFLFKFAYDAASLTISETKGLQEFALACPITSAAAFAMHQVLDHWLFSALLCSVLVAYIFQVPAKLMAQNHPMRFLTKTWLAIYCPLVSRWVGLLSQLVRPLRALRRRGEQRHRNGQFSYFAGPKEFTPIDTQQALASLVNLSGELIQDLSFTLRQAIDGGVPVWRVQVRAVYKVVVPSRIFGHVIQLHDVNRLIYRVAAFRTADQSPQRPQELMMSQIKLVSELPKREEIHAHLHARFDSKISAGSEVEWEAKYTIPVATVADETASFQRNTFEVSISKPVRRVTLYVDETQSSDPEVRILPIEGVQTPGCGPTEAGRVRGWRYMKVEFPSIGSRLQFRF